ncbi:MAG: hypothetical protein JWM41_2903 [Gemmatimonadetes bacterium]|nr:hypothetical protein [Gemmatimonadota bacterium]
MTDMPSGSPLPEHYVRPNWLTETCLAFVDPTSRVGAGTKVWHFARVLQHCTIGMDASIGGGVEVGRGTTIGNRSRIGSGVFLPPNSVIGRSVFIGPNVTFTDDREPCVPEPGDAPYHAQPPIVEDGAAIGAGAIILPGVRIGAHARVAAGAVVTEDVPAFCMVVGLPARIRATSDHEHAWIPLKHQTPVEG